MHKGTVLNGKENNGTSVLLRFLLDALVAYAVRNVQLLPLLTDAASWQCYNSYSLYRPLQQDSNKFIEMQCTRCTISNLYFNLLEKNQYGFVTTGVFVWVIVWAWVTECCELFLEWDLMPYRCCNHYYYYFVSLFLHQNARGSHRAGWESAHAIAF